MTARSPQQLKSTVAAVTIIHPHKNSIVYMNNILELPALEKEQDMYYYELMETESQCGGSIAQW